MVLGVEMRWFFVALLLAAGSLPTAAVARDVTVGDATVTLPVSANARPKVSDAVWEATDPESGWKWRLDRIGDGLRAYPSSAETQAIVLDQFKLGGQTEVVETAVGDKSGFLFGAASASQSTRFCFRGHNGSIYLLGVWVPRDAIAEGEAALVAACSGARFAAGAVSGMDPVAVAGFRFGSGEFDYALPRGWSAEQGAVTFTDASGLLAGVAMRQPRPGNPLGSSDGLELQRNVAQTGFTISQRELLEAGGRSGWLFTASRASRTGRDQEFLLAVLRSEASIWYLQVPRGSIDPAALGTLLRAALKGAVTQD